MNSLHNETLTWVGDGADGCTLEQTDNNVVIVSKSVGTPFNVYCNSEKASSDYYFQASIQQLKGNFSIGVVSKDEFRPGWKTKGMFYNSNLTNGGGALKVGWGPRFEAGDSLGVRVTPGSEHLEVSFYKNGACLGTGFRLAGNTTTYYPCLHVSGTCHLSVDIPKDLPSKEVAEEAPSGILGDWKIDKAWDGEDAVSFPEAKPLKVNLEKEKGGLQMGFAIANRIGGQAKIIEETDTSMTVESSRMMMTRMMPPPEFRPLENLIGSKSITTLVLEENTKLTLSGPEIKIECSRYVRTPEALDRY